MAPNEFFQPAPSKFEAIRTGCVHYPVRIEQETRDDRRAATKTPAPDISFDRTPSRRPPSRNAEKLSVAPRQSNGGGWPAAE
jgi:hypothetical protein